MHENPNAAQPKSRRRWHQYSLRTLLIVVTLAGCGLGWLGIKVREQREEAADVEAIKKLGGSSVYDYEVDPGLEAAGLSPFAWVHGVDLSNTSFSDADFAHLQGLTQLKGLRLDGTRVTDDGLADLKGLTQLRWLSLKNTRVTEAGLEHLTVLTHLEILYLRGTQISASGARKLHQALPKCQIQW